MQLHSIRNCSAVRAQRVLVLADFPETRPVLG
jgi:hypothetical protein